MDSLTPKQNSAFSGYERLKQDIIRGVFKPGEKLLMSGLKERYDLGLARCERRFRSWWPSIW